MQLDHGGKIMHKAICIMGLSLALLLGQTLLLAATVKKKNGDVVEGTIQGLIVQREGKQDSVTYVIRKGSDITAIDARGVILKKGSKMDRLTIYMEGKSAEEIEKLGGSGGMVMRVSGEGKALIDPAPLLGEYTGSISANQIKGAITPSIRVKTKEGIVTIPVAEIVEFAEEN
jgi:hypothetical protein